MNPGNHLGLGEIGQLLQDNGFFVGVTTDSVGEWLLDWLSG